MEILKKYIVEKGTIGSPTIPNLIKVDSFLNQQMDTYLFNEIGKEFYNYFKDKKINKILTIEASGIGIAIITAQYFDNIPVVFAKKLPSELVNEKHYCSQVFSFTKKQTNNICVSKEYLNKDDHILIIDDFLADGKAVIGLMNLIEHAGSTLEGVGIVIGKTFQPGKALIEEKGIDLKILAPIKSINGGKVEFE